MNLEEEMYQLVEDYQNSGKTQKEYSREAKIGYAKFNYWVCKYRALHPTPAPGFIKIEALQDNQQPQDLEVLYPNGVKLKITGADLSLLSQLIRLY